MGNISERTKRIRAQQADTSSGETFIVEHASPALRALDAIYAEWDLQGVSSGYKKRDAFFIEREFPGYQEILEALENLADSITNFRGGLYTESQRLEMAKNAQTIIRKARGGQ